MPGPPDRTQNPDTESSTQIITPDGQKFFTYP